jgi:hypothetical protein
MASPAVPYPVEVVDYVIGASPYEDGVAYPADDGRLFYRPGLRVARRPPGLFDGPDVWFRRDDRGAVRLEWRLAEQRPPTVQQDAAPIPLAVDAVRMVWNGGQRAFDPPVPMVADNQDGAGFVLDGGAALLPDEATVLEAAMCDASSGCRLEVDYHYDVIAEIVVDRDGVGHRNPYRTAVTRMVPFCFNPNDEQNRPIYRELHGQANLTTEWRKSAAGWLRGADLPNTVYRIPDELRLAFDTDLGTPHVVITLHADDTGRNSVRVLLRVAPWQDPARVVRARELVGAPAAQVVVGPVPAVTLRLGGSFPEAVGVMGGPVAFSLADGVDLLLDLSPESFQLLCGMIGGAVGLPGQVDVPLATPDGPVTVAVPVSLRMDRVSGLPVGVDVLAGAGAPPTAVRITNRARTPIVVGGCAAVLLRTDADSVAPLATLPARCTGTFPLELAPDATAELTVEPAEPPGGLTWNDILVDLLDTRPVLDARSLLLRANELAGSGELTWDVRLSCPVLEAAAVASRWATLVAVEVEVSAPGFDTTTVVLRRGEPTRPVTMRKPLAELLTGAAAGIRTLTYRVRNNYSDHQGSWTAPQQQSGEDLIVYPNPAPND